MSASIDPKYLAKCLDYNPETGVLIWKLRPINHFATLGAYKKFKNDFVGNVAGAPAHGYLRFGLTVEGRCYPLYAHRVAWCLMTGAWPIETIDHVNGDKSNNCWLNLREATRQQNLRNTPVRSHCKSGIKGVKITKQGRFSARLTFNKKSIHLGTFNTAEDAQRAFSEKAIDLHGEFLHSSVKQKAGI